MRLNIFCCVYWSHVGLGAILVFYQLCSKGEWDGEESGDVRTANPSPSPGVLVLSHFPYASRVDFPPILTPGETQTQSPLSWTLVALPQNRRTKHETQWQPWHTHL